MNYLEKVVSAPLVSKEPKRLAFACHFSIDTIGYGLKYIYK